jgi:hypothetical protein
VSHEHRTRNERRHLATNYGGIQLDPDDSQKVAVLVERLLRAKLRKAGAK